MNQSNHYEAKHYAELPIFDGVVPSELSQDYILPDTYPDVKKLLRVSAKPVLISRYVSGKRLEFSGAVDYTVIFSADAENGEVIKCVHFAGEWNNALGELENLDNADIFISPKLSSCSARLSNPRKLSIRTSVASDVKVMGNVCCDPVIESKNTPAAKLEKLTENVVSRRSSTFVPEPLRLSQDIELDPSSPAIDEIISCSVNMLVSETRPHFESNGLTVSMKGNAFISCLYKAMGEAGTYRSLCRTIPISHTVRADECKDSFDGCQPDTFVAKIGAVPTEINAAVGEDSYGERRVLELDVTADMILQMFANHDTVLTLDAYSTRYDCECSTEDVIITQSPRLFSQNFTVSESVQRESLGLPENILPIDLNAELTPENVTVSGGKAVITGKADISCIYSNKNSYANMSATVPIKFEMNVGDMETPYSYSVDTEVSDIRVRLDNERVYFDFEASMCLDVSKKCRHKAVRSVKMLGESAKREDNGILTVCYPAENETLWDISKRYGISRAELEAANQPESRVLMIPSSKIRSFVV